MIIDDRITWPLAFLLASRDLAASVINNLALHPPHD